MSDVAYPPLEGAPPVVWDESTAGEMERALQQLAVADAIIRAGEAVQIPMAEVRAECDAMCAAAQRILAHVRGQQSPHPGPIGG